MVRTAGFHPVNRGSIPRSGTKKLKILSMGIFNFMLRKIEQGKGSGKPRFSRGGSIETERFQKRTQ